MKIDVRAAAIGAVAALGAFFVFRASGPAASDADPTAAIPKDTFLAATIDLADLRKSPVYSVIFGNDGPSKALGVGKLANACGFDPLSRVGKLAVAVPEEGETGELGVAAQISVSGAEIERCTKGIPGAKGEPVRVGSFGVVEAEGPSRPRIAYGKDGLLVAGSGPWFDAMLAAAEGTRPSLAQAKEHAALRTALVEREGWRTPTIVATALLPAEIRERVRREMGAELKSEDASAAAMGGVLGVSGVGLAIRTGGRVDAAAVLVCDSADACAAVEKLILKKRLDLSKELALRMIGLGPVIDSIETTTEEGGKRLRVSANADARKLADTIERLLRLRARREQAPPPSKNETPAPKPDETLRQDEQGKRDAGPL